MKVRTWDGHLICQVSGCGAELRALTGLMELRALMAHYALAHLARITMTEALEIRAKWEARELDA